MLACLCHVFLVIKLPEASGLQARSGKAKTMIANAAPLDGDFARLSTHKDSPLDLVHLAKQTLGDRSLENEILRLFLKQSDSCMEKVVNAASNDDRFQAAHTIKGSASNIGAWDVAHCASEVEAAREQSIQDDIKSLRTALNNTCAFIRSILDDVG